MAQLSFVSPDKEKPPRVKDIEPSGNMTIIKVGHAAGIDISATCGERGRCRACRVKILSGQVPPPTMQDRIQLGEDEIRENFRLACQTQVIGDCTVLLAPPMKESGHQIMGGDFEVERAGLELDSGIKKFFINANAPTEENHQTSDTEEILSC